MNARPRKVETIVLGRGLLAAALAAALVGRGRRVALLVEEPGWARGVVAAPLGVHEGPDVEVAQVGAAWLSEAQGAGLPGVEQADDGSGWRLDLDYLLPALGERVAAGEGCWLAVGTRVRGISVIENAVLGAIAEDARYDARQVVNAAEDERHAAFARMMREPAPVDLARFGAGPTSVQGGWRVRGVADQPLVALGATLRLAEQLLA